MFKKTKIAAISAAVLGLSSMTAQAVSLNESASEGEVLIFPYYNVNNGFATTFNITNTTPDYKAIKVRFRESNTSNDVLDFNLYMSPYDMFTMSLSQTEDGGVLLKTTDNSCTQPRIKAAGVEFRDAYDSVDAGDLREGYLEVIEMGVIDEDAFVWMDAEKVLIASEGIEHNTDGMPKDCSVIEEAWQNGVFRQGGAESNGLTDGGLNWVNPKANGYPDDAALGGGTVSTAGFYGTDSEDWTTQKGALTAPTGGLVGSSVLIDFDHVAGFVVEPTSVVNYSSRAQHYLSSDENFYLLPSLASGSVATTTSITTNFSAVRTVKWDTVVRDWGMDDINLLPRTSVPSGINPMPIADAMAVVYVGNQYFLSGGVSTDWVIATPMRKHAIFNDYAYVPPATPLAASFDVGSDIPVGSDDPAASEIQIKIWAAQNGYWKHLDATDVKAKFIYLDREEQKETPESGDFSPPIATVDVYVPFEREVNILSLSTGSTPSSVLGSAHAQGLTLASGFEDGWGSFDFSKYNLAGTRYTAWAGNPVDMNNPDAVVNAYGVPVAGFMSARAAVGSASLGETFPHFVKRTK